jgi:hypothetical protein
MKKLFVFFALLLSLNVSTIVVAQTFIKPTDPNITYLGRISFENPEALKFTYPGIQFHINFQGTSVSMVTKPGSGYFMIELDNLEPYKVHSCDSTDIVKIAEGLDNTMHRLTVTYINEGLVMKPIFYGFVLDEGCCLGEKPTLPSRKIEFIGNSITCGLGNEWDGVAKRHDYSMQNQYYTYAAIAARELNAQCFVVARSGIGIYRNTNGNVNGDKNNFQAVYPFTNFGTTGERWNFKNYTPDVVCVNLGTNDTTNPTYKTELLAAAYKKFIGTLRLNYPNAKIILLTGTMVKGQRLANIQKAQKEAIAYHKSRGDNQIYRLDFTPADGSLGYGYAKHPSKAQHELMAAELVPFIRKITGWE